MKLGKIVIARNEATKQSRAAGASGPGLLRFARNDGLVNDARMSKLRPHPVLLAFAALVMAAAATATAQDRTTATYEDWVLQCEVQVGPPPRKACDIAQVTQVQGRNVPLSRIAVARPEKGQAIKLTVQVPVNIQLGANVRIQASDADTGLAVPFDRCLPAGCFAEFELKDDVLRKFRAAADGGKLTYKAANGQAMTIPVSFKGFARAFDALAKE
jgi:invasion protein IalB